MANLPYGTISLKFSSQSSSVIDLLILRLAKYIFPVALSSIFNRLSFSSSQEHEEVESFIFLILLYDCIGIDSFLVSMLTILFIRDGRFFSNPLHGFWSTCQSNKTIFQRNFKSPNK